MTRNINLHYGVAKSLLTRNQIKRTNIINDENSNWCNF